MKQLVMLTAAGLMALVLSGCEQKPKQPETNTEVTVQTQPKEEVKSVEVPKTEDTVKTTTTTEGQ